MSDINLAAILEQTIQEARIARSEIVQADGIQQIIIPEEMTYKQAAAICLAMEKKANAISHLKVTIKKYLASDVFVAVAEAFSDVFGDQVEASNARNFFTGELAHTIEPVLVGYDEHGNPQQKIAMHGTFEIPYWDDAEIKITSKGHFAVVIQAQIKNKWSERFNAFIQHIKDHLKEKSIFKNNAVMLENGKGLVPMYVKPTEGIFLSDSVNSVIEDIVIGAFGVKKRRTYLFRGSYGTGKTETAFYVGREAIKKGYTFLYVHSPDMFELAMEFALNYEPCLIFLEDVDVITSGGRNPVINNILNKLDGSEFKNREIHIIFTTNHAERINSAARRPGRIDMSVEFGPLDAKAISHIYEFHTRNFKREKGLNFDELAEHTLELRDEVPGCVAKEVTNIVSLLPGTITKSSFKGAIDMGLRHHDFMRGKQENVQNPYEVFFETLKSDIANEVSANL